jgi:ElaB/YqjD/DUF883 family membrane-anchored ribosome-binding protein
MSIETVEATEHEKPASVVGRIVDAARQVAHLSHETQLAGSVAEDAIENGVHAAKRAAVKSVRRRVERLEDLKDEGIHYVKRQPLRAVTAVAAAGFAVGLATGWLAGRVSLPRASNSR